MIDQSSQTFAGIARSDSTPHRPMMWHGVFLFLIGLVTGTQQRRFTNMRMALSAHLEGVMNGTFLIALGAIWGSVKIPPAVEKPRVGRHSSAPTATGCSPRSAPLWVRPPRIRPCRKDITGSRGRNELSCSASGACAIRSSLRWC